MGTVNRTYSMPIDVDRDLHVLVKPRNISRFVAESVKQRLARLSDKLSKEYAAANKDAGQKEAMKDWESTISDGLEAGNDW